MIEKYVSMSHIGHGLFLFIGSNEIMASFSFDHERLLNDKNIFEELQKQNYRESPSIIGFHM